MANKKTNKSSMKKRASDLSNEELLEQIMSKKRNKKSTSSKRKETKDSNNKIQKNDKVKDIVHKELTNDEIYEQIKAKKKKKAEVKESFIKKETDVNAKDVSNKVKQEDLIITREISFDEKFDLNNKKNLKKLREAIEEFDRLEALEEKEKIETTEETKVSDLQEEITKEEQVTREIKYKDNRVNEPEEVITYEKRSFKYRKFIIIGVILFIIFIFLIVGYFFIKKDDDGELIFNNNDLQKEEEVREKELFNKFQDCLDKPYSEDSLSDEVILKKDELINYLKDNYETSVLYEDLNSGFNFSYNSDVIYYAASTIKSLDALYIYTKAASGEINLDDTMTYTSKYKWGSSKEMSKLSYGTEVSLRDLVKYAINVSDNSAHQMLISYIGKSNLKEFGNSLGAKNTLIGADNFGNIDVYDAIIYMKAINDFINNNPKLGAELKSYFIEAEQNDLELPDEGILAAHKYGQYSYYYHDIGIVYDDDPYVVAILTLEGKHDYEEIVKDINKHVYELHKFYNEEKEKMCRIEVYGN